MSSLRLKNPLTTKLDRLAAGGTPRVLDLFSGCGGISLGFLRAGFDVVGGIESDVHAARTCAMNLHKHVSEAKREILARPRNIAETTPSRFLQGLGFRRSAEAVDVIVGGPPCQAYARVGRAKLREIRNDPDAHQLDERGSLYEHYLRFVKTLKPLALLMENVPDILNHGGANVAEAIARDLEKKGYQVRYTLLNAVHYGVPQTRERLYLIAYHEVLGEIPEFPAATHYLEDLPRGYTEIRALAKRLHQELRLPLVPRGAHPLNCFVSIPEPGPELPPAITTREALNDLPRILEPLRGEVKRGARRLNETLPYGNRTMTEYALLMRELWEGFEATGVIPDHAIRYLPRDYPIFARMKPGDQYPQALKLAERMFDDKLKNLARCGECPVEDSEAWKDLRKSMVPPYDPGKFPNKWRKLEPDRPARTLMAHLAHDSYSHIHHDDEQARTISVREAARLQSFPDGFRFSGTMNPAFRQIGNAVPPLMSFALAQKMMAVLMESVAIRHCQKDSGQRRIA